MARSGPELDSGLRERDGPVVGVVALVATERAAGRFPEVVGAR
ncbi:hypothetical protein [Halobellus litoreus]|uniref:Uncharacterized protein n=1 Tax=Halobellus litoreus TaxID=755310 RepID=A0ABD6DQP4_9EURY